MFSKRIVCIIAILMTLNFIIFWGLMSHYDFGGEEIARIQGEQFLDFEDIPASEDQMKKCPVQPFLVKKVILPISYWVIFLFLVGVMLFLLDNKFIRRRYTNWEMRNLIDMERDSDDEEDYEQWNQFFRLR